MTQSDGYCMYLHSKEHIETISNAIDECLVKFLASFLCNKSANDDTVYVKYLSRTYRNILYERDN